ncbi:MAG TPA: ABC transporter permease [Chloroflexota bacterium]|nr:ABC transporter permease [Chloroflexota bacterium]
MPIVLRYILRRLLLTVPVLVAMSVFVFAIIHLAPGDPVQAALGLSYSPGAAAVLRHQMGLDQPIVQQYFTWVGNMLHGDMGQDLISHQPLTDLLSQRLPVTLELTILSMGLAVCLAIPLGVAAARKPGGIVDRCLAGITLLGISVPDFVLGTLLILLFAATLNWLPPEDYVPFSQSPGDNLRHLILPVIALALAEVAYISQTTRASMLETLQQDYITFLRAKGIREGVVAYRHALRNAAVPVVTVIGVQFGALLGGAIVVENVFSLPGVGKMIVDAVSTRNYPIVQGGVLVIALIFILVNLVTDLLYTVLNPRIAYGQP